MSATPPPASGELAGAGGVPPTGEMRGLRAGTIVFLGIAAGNLGNYLFHFVSARLLGPASYGDVASLVAVIGLVSLPLVGVQVVVTRYVARFLAEGAVSAVAVLYTKALRVAGLVGLAVTAALCALAFPLREFLGIDSLFAVVLTGLVAAPSIVSPVIWGVAQGFQRFTLFTVSIGLGPALRPVVAVVLLAAGLGVAGAMVATLVAAVVATAVPLFVLRTWLTRDLAQPTPVGAGEVARFLVPTLIGVLSITSLTTADVIVAKAALSDTDAGLYGSASLIGRVVLYLPAAIVLVLLPKVSAREAAGRESRDVLAKSLLVTLGFCAVAIVVYAVAPRVLVFLAFGSGFKDAAGLLWMFAVAMSGYALLNVLLTYQLARGAYRLSFVLLAGAVCQLALFVVFHGSPEQLLTVSIAVALVLLLVHEAVVMRTLPVFGRAGVVRNS